MPMKVRQRLDNVRVRLQAAGSLITSEVNDALKKEAEQIQIKARSYAPLEHGNLMDAIKTIQVGRKTVWAVYIDRDHPDDTGRYTVEVYAFRLHEDTTWKPGPLTKPPRGPKFLERAYVERSKGFAKRMQEAAKRGLSKLGL